MAKLGVRLMDWVEKHQRAWRAFVIVVYGWLAYSHVSDMGDDGHTAWWEVAWLFAMVCIVGTFAWTWWRMDVLDEFSRRVRDAIGSDANLVIFTARVGLRTRSVARLNRIMREYDIMNVSPLDLPPEAKELREILESVRTL